MTSFICATWNVNSIRARLPVVLDWLENNHVDVLALQEIKCETSVFPTPFFEELGFQCAVSGQKTYNGVAILSRSGLEDINTSLPNWDVPQARYIDALVGGRLRVVNVYVPNGREIDCPAYEEKLIFLAALHSRLQNMQNWDEPIVVGGDWNIAPRECDVHAYWTEPLLCSPKERRAFHRILEIGFDDVLAGHIKAPYTWWDYRAKSFDRNIGLRIDHWLASSQTRVTQSFVDRAPRAMPKTSDHAPVVIQIEV